MHHDHKTSVKNCEQSDFGNDTKAKKYYEMWVNDDYQYELFCPDLEEQDLQLYNEKGHMKVKSIIFRVEKCVDPVD